MNTNTEREELARELFVVDNGNQSREQSLVDWEWFESTDNYRGRIQHYKDMAAGMITAGYSKPRTITTAEELDALVEGSVVKDRQGDVIERVHGSWYFGDYSDSRPSLPATVLYTPELIA